MKLKNATDKQVVVKGYAVDVECWRGYMSFQVSYSDCLCRYVFPDDYVCVTLNDDQGREFYIIAPKDTPAGEEN